ncbi:Mechanosensitive ion channel [Nitrosospira multiformis]|uniref:Mechanosensitive ion channel n=1 Tax=Nitrosospira multiformis TaxID=1231 RepID=A0A1I0BJZ6_9PROT|nr:mechanosensitive ion channel domain-containing protein [Nitrosospira multiformis]SET07308.1 Mechanosensitive ion channel [Nitrosospira multiformis]
MHFDIEFQSLLNKLLVHAQQVPVLWQLAVLTASMGMAWLLQRQFMRRAPARVNAGGKLTISARSLSRLLFPFFALVFTVVGKWALDYWYPTHLLNIIIPILFALVLIRAGVYMLRKVFRRQEWLRPWERFIGWTVWIGFALYITGLLPEILALLDDISLHVGKQRISILLIAQGLIAFTVSMLVAASLASSVETRIMMARALNINQRVILSKISRTILIVIGVLVALPMVGVDITFLSVFGGALGVGLGLGLQKIASNYISGFIILLDHSLHLGDIVTVDNRKGEVTSLTTRYVILKSEEGTNILIPNDVFITSAVINHPFSDRRLRLVFPMRISYDSPIEAAMIIMSEAAKRRQQILAEPVPVVYLKEFIDGGIVLELVAWVEEAEKNLPALRSDINLDIWRTFGENGIKR